MRRSRRNGQLRRVLSINALSHFGDEHRRLRSRLGENSPERIADERVAEELDAVGARLVLVADAIGRRDVDAVGDRVRALGRAPRFDLRLAVLRFLRRMPADRRRIKNYLGAEQAA